MEEPTRYKLFFNSSIFYIPSSFRSLSDVDEHIYSTLISTKEYIVKSNVTKDVFESFLNHWVDRKVPIINENNINEFILLSDEFDHMKDIIEIYHKKVSEKNYFQKEIQNLNNTINEQEKKIKIKDKNIQKIITYITDEFGEPNDDFFDQDDLGEINVNIYKYLIQEKYCTKSGLQFALNKKNKTATLLSNKNIDKSEINIPKSIKVDSTNYIVKKIFNNSFSASKCEFITFSSYSQLEIIGKNSFSYSNIKTISIPSSVKKIGKSSFAYCKQLESIKFSTHSKLQKICKKAFEGSSIKSLSIPSSVEKFEDEWCSGITNLNNIKIKQNTNENILYYEDSFIIGKSDITSDDFDVLLFARRDIICAKIPSFIKRINSNAFENCKSLKIIEFSDDSELQSIGKFSFANSGIEKISIPQYLTTIEECAFSNCKMEIIQFSKDSELKIIEKLAFLTSEINEFIIPSSIEKFEEEWSCQAIIENIKILQNNVQNIILYEDSFIIGKLDLKSDNFDNLLFACRSIENARIPSFIKRIESYAFENCYALKTVEFTKDSQLEQIGKFAFCLSTLESILIPSHVSRIELGAFKLCSGLKKISFEENSELASIDDMSFSETAIEQISIPVNVIKIGFKSFGSCKNLRNVIFEKNSNLISIGKCSFFCTDIRKITIPSNTIEICELAFANCKNLQYVEFSRNSKLKTIEQSAFSGTSIEKIVIPSNVVNLGKEIFLNFSDQKVLSVQFENDLNLISMDKTFCYSSINSLCLPPHIKIIDIDDFSNCKFLQIIEIQENSEIRMININGFKNSANLIIMIPIKLNKQVKFDLKPIYGTYFI